MRDTILFEQPYRNSVWRVVISQYRDKTFANLRRWYRDDEGGMKPTREGFTMPLDRLDDLANALAEWQADERDKVQKIV